jgi:2-oxoglutarate ferredoxin oxidoreductase subunit alpha
MKRDAISVLVGGEAGQGITRSGSLLTKALMRAGLNVFGVNDYPSVIRGSHNFYQIRASNGEVNSQGDELDLVLALNKETVLLHEAELTEGGGVIHDEGVSFEKGELKRDDVAFHPVPLRGIVEEIGGTPIMMNTVALGAASALIGLDPEVMKEVIADTFSGRPGIIEANNRAIQLGHDHVRGHRGVYQFDVEYSPEARERIMPTGNDAVAFGAIQAGCRFYAAYPMTPASPVLHYLMANDTEAGMIVVQSESEIAAATSIVGASFAGLRAMTATSGGGFCLMTEALGLAAMTENPVVVMLGQRPGPSTGMATYTAQGDLLFALHASQGEFPRVVVAPGDVDECFYLTMEAFNLADAFQIPAIILTDKYLIESHKSTEPFDPGRVGIDRGALIEEAAWEGPGEYRRFQITESGVSPRAVPGTKGAIVLANSNEHLERGYTTIEPGAVMAMVDKRFRKAEVIWRRVEGMNPLRVYGDEDPEITLVGWGSTKGPALDALSLLREEGVRARFVQVVYMEPFPGREMGALLAGGGSFLLLETNRTAQLGRLLRLNCGFEFEHVHLRYDGRPFTPGEIRRKSLEVLGR